MRTSNLRVGTYNVRLDTAEDGENAWDNRRLDVARMIRSHAPDLLGLQEPLPNQLADLKESLSSYTFLGRSRRRSPDEGEFSPIAVRDSAFDVLDHGTFWLSENPSVPGSVGWNAAHPRIATWCRVEHAATGATLYHYNTHLDHESAEARRRGVELLKNDVRERTGADPVVLTGDFNATPADEAYELAVDGSDDEGLVDAKAASAFGHFGLETTFNDYENPIPETFIDHVFVTPEVTVSSHAVHTDVRTNGRYPSDHFPVVAAIEIQSGD